MYTIVTCVVQDIPSPSLKLFTHCTDKNLLLRICIYTHVWTTLLFLKNVAYFLIMLLFSLSGVFGLWSMSPLFRDVTI